jgi:hypothetical protein
MTYLLNYIDYWTREEHSCKNTLCEIKVHCLFVFVTPVLKKQLNGDTVLKIVPFSPYICSTAHTFISSFYSLYLLLYHS